MRRQTLKMLILVLATLLVLLCGTTFALMYRQTAFLENQFDAAVVSCQIEETFNGTSKTEITVKNTGNIDAYLRLRLVSYWVDSNGNIIYKPSVPIPVPFANGWIKGSDNTYYYPHPVSPEHSTLNLLGSEITLEDGQVIEVFADAIQSKPDTAVTKSWGVTISDGRIDTVP